MEKNLEIWDKLRAVPDEAKRTIQAGRLKGFTDINPQWRYRELTAIFGPCGMGWKYEIAREWMQDAQGETVHFVQINLYYKIDDKWSDPIPSIGGSKFVAKESKGPYVSDESAAMSITDALGKAAKMIGLAANVYMRDQLSAKYDTEKKQDDAGRVSSLPQDVKDLLKGAGYNTVKTAVEYLDLFLEDDKWDIDKVRKALNELNGGQIDGE